MATPQQTNMESIDQAERCRLQKLRLVEPLTDDTLCQLDRILASRTFGRVQSNAKDFLVFVVAKTLLGRAGQIKEMTIALAVFHESTDFNPLESSKIRVAGSALRQRVETYYRQEGRHDPIKISIPEGTYVPDIRDERVTILIENLVSWTPKCDRHLSSALADEVMRLLNVFPRVKAVQTESRQRQSRVAYRLRGSIETSDSMLRLNVSLLDESADSIALWHTFEVCRRDAFRLPMQVATAISKTLTVRCGQTCARLDESNRRLPIYAPEIPDAGRPRSRTSVSVDPASS